MDTKANSNKKIAAAVAEYKTSPKQLRLLSQLLRKPETRKACRICATKLLKLEPTSKDAIASLIYAYANSSYSEKIRTALDLAHQNRQGNEDNLKKILHKVFKYLNEKEVGNFEGILHQYKIEKAEISRRQQINLNARTRLLNRASIEANSCDVITVASNEGPYIAEFIHHYIYQGFRNLFIGLNNDTSGQTGPIVELIAEQYPQVHLINTDQEHQQGQQRSSYCKLYDEASKISQSSHCMVVDVDESWVAYPLTTTIKEFLAAQPEADVISSNWLHCHGGNLFDNPLNLSNTRLELTNKFKSLFRYGTAVTDIGAHVPSVLDEPTVRHTSSDGQKINALTIDNEPLNGLRRLSKSGIQACIETTNTGWVIHRHTRSELEYSAKLLHPDVNELANPFKPNRTGYLLREEGVESRQLATNLLGPSHRPPQAYLNSLEAFIDRCGVNELIHEAKAEKAKKANKALNTKIAAAVAKSRSNPKRSRIISQLLRKPETRKTCRIYATKLLKLNPDSKDAIASLIYTYAHEDYSGKIRTALDLAHQHSQSDPEILSKILSKVFKSLNEQEIGNFEGILHQYKIEKAEISRRQQINLNARTRLLNRASIEANSCDVITVASNEGPYIAEFIHHYIYQGFRNLFIGLNNDTSGQTGPIVELIAEQYPQVHLINTDQEHQQGQQRSSYCKLYDEASKISQSSHCMVVDVDESWVAYPLTTTIKEFLAAQPEADVISSNWLHCHGGNLFDNPLNLSNTRLELTNKFKSLFRYGTAVTDIGAHVPSVLDEPTVRHTSSDGQKINALTIDNEPLNGLRRLSKSGIQACIETTNTGWVIHRHTRSELEYSAKLLHPDVNELANPFKPNRTGYLLREEGVESRQLATNLLGPSHRPPQAYLNSLEAFIDRCGVNELIHEARAQIDEEQIKETIKAMNPKMIKTHQTVWQRTFRGTRFLKMLEQRCCECDVEPIA